MEIVLNRFFMNKLRRTPYIHIFQRFLVIFTGILLLPSLSLRAQKNTAAETGNIEEKELSEMFNYDLKDLMNIKIISTSKKMEKIQKAPGTIYVVTDKMIRKRGYTNLKELLEDIPEIEIQSNSTSRGLHLFSIRGITGSSKFVILYNGFRLSCATGEKHVINTNFFIGNAKRVEIILGPASALYGADAFAGIINIISQKGSELNGGSVTGSYGMYNSTHNSFMAGYDFGPLSVGVHGHYYHSNEPNYAELFKDDYAWYHDHWLPNGEMDFFGSTVTVSGYSREYEQPTNSYSLGVQLDYKTFSLVYTRNRESYSPNYTAKPEYSILSRESVFSTLLELFYVKHTLSGNGDRWRLQSSIMLNSYEVGPESNYINRY
ncbi:MAG: TonB-dependent receptor plug domain-containing protein [bacterium]|nr:TonB-dependent receptor plug domain-containing protein [bacterium]